MNASRYRELCAAPSAFPRSTLEDSYGHLSAEKPDLATAVRGVLESDAIPKPRLHTGGKDSDFFVADLPARTVADIVDFLGAKESAAVIGDEPDLANRLATLLDAWNR